MFALPKANGIVIRYTTDGSSPTSAGFATYDGSFRVPAKCRIVCAIAVASAYDLHSETIRIPIPQPGRPPIDPTIPARWNQQTKLDDSAAVWDFIRRLEMPHVPAPMTSASRLRAVMANRTWNTPAP